MEYIHCCSRTALSRKFEEKTIVQLNVQYYGLLNEIKFEFEWVISLIESMYIFLRTYVHLK